MKRTKGEFGYLAYRRKRTIVLAILMLGIVAAVYFGARAYFGTNQNYFSIVAALLCLPTAKLIVNMIMYLRARGCSLKAYEKITSAGSVLPGAFDLYLTSEKHNFALSHACVADGSVVALTEDPKCDLRAGEQHIRRMMQQNNFHGYNVKIFDRMDQYISRLSTLNELISGTDEKGERLLQLFYRISL